MKQEDKVGGADGLRVGQLAWVLFGSALSVFGLLLLTMAELEDFSQSAFSYWVPRASLVVVVSTALGWLVRKKGLAVRFGFGFIAGLVLAFLYITVT